MPDRIDQRHLSRRQFVRRAGVLALASAPLGALAAVDTGEGVTFAAGPLLGIGLAGLGLMRRRRTA